MKNAYVLALVMLLSLLFLSAGCQPPTADGDGGTAECTKEETYTVQVPYNETEFYSVKEGVGRPFCKEEQYTDFTLDVVPLGTRCKLKVTNTGNITGDWTLKVKWITTESGGGPESEPLTKELGPGEEAIFDYEYDQSDIPTSCKNVNVETPSVEVCKYTFYQDVRKSRTVTKFKEETRTRTVPCD